MTNDLIGDYSQEEMNRILAADEACRIAHDAEVRAKRPKCHFRPMELEGDECDGWWLECTVCGHTKHRGER